MSSDLRISPRERLVLVAIIESYIATGQPVGSQAIARQLGNKDGMSAATIRNIMASLDESGLLDQPHTSAGRVPTEAGYRIYVDGREIRLGVFPMGERRDDPKGEGQGEGQEEGQGQEGV